MLDQTPSAAFRAKDLRGAIGLAELTGPERRALWLLLLHWEALDCNRRDDAAVIFTHLTSSTAPSLKGWKAKLAVHLLAELQPQQLHALAKLRRELLAENKTWISLLARLLAKRGYGAGDLQKILP
jgi:hypothetical protein